MAKQSAAEQDKGIAQVRRVVEAGARDATVLENGLVRIMVDDSGGMVPELSARVKDPSPAPKPQKTAVAVEAPGGYLNAHWMPWFRSNSGKPFSAAKDAAFWKANLLYDLAGNFPCVPTFGGGGMIDGTDIPPHGWTANNRWHFEKQGADHEAGAAWALSTMESPNPGMPLSFKKIDAVLKDKPVHYTSLILVNNGDNPAEINIAWHNTVGSPFLQAGCRISAAAESWTTPPTGGEFDTTGRLAFGKKFDSLEAAPLRNGGTVDLSCVPGQIGYTDFAAGAVPRSAKLGWSAVVNSELKMAYLCFFPGPKGVKKNEIALSFNNLWMQYGGRPFTPWAAYDGGSDLTYCLGTENSLGAYAYGLAYAREHRKILGAPTTVVIPAHASMTLRYGTLFAAYSGTVLDGGIGSVEKDGERLICQGKKMKENGKSGSKQTIFPADPDFNGLKSIEGILGFKPA